MNENTIIKIVGRDVNCDFVLNDLSVSRRHLQIEFLKSNNTFNITDLGSSNGTLLNGQKINTNVIAKYDDAVKVGDFIFDFKLYFKKEYEDFLKNSVNNIFNTSDDKKTSLINVSVGRTFENHIIIENTTISRKHAEIIQIDWTPSFVIKDLGSTNGSFVDGIRINGESNKVMLNSFIRFGSQEFNLAKELKPFLEKASKKLKLADADKGVDESNKTIIKPKDIKPIDTPKVEVESNSTIIQPKLNTPFYVENKPIFPIEIINTNSSASEMQTDEGDREILFKFKFEKLFSSFSAPSIENPISVNSVGREYPHLLRIGNYEVNNTNYPYLAYWGESTKGLLIDWDKKYEEGANQVLQNTVVRLLACIPPKKANVKIVDFAGNGLSFPDLMALDSKIISNDVIDNTSECNQFLTSQRQKTGDLVRNVLMNRTENIIRYNNENKDLAVNIDILVIHRFPYGWDTASVGLLSAVLKNGIKTGMLVLMSIDHNALQQMLEGNKDVGAEFDIDILQQDFVTISSDLKHKQKPSFPIYSEEKQITISTAKMANMKEIISTLNLEVHKVENIEIDIRSRLGALWTGNSSKGLKIPIGQAGLSILNFELGSASNVHHALIGGATGSGKSVLLHNLIINGSHVYSPAELQFVLLDYKEGTEFKIYQQLPHMHILSIESRRTFGVAVLEYLQEQIVERAKLFKAVEAANIAEYKERSQKALPRLLVIIDEFQVLLSGGDRLSNEAADRLEDLSKRGRSFGINLVLSSQSLSDVNISSSTQSNLNLRVALKMTEADSNKFLSHENSVPVRFNRPGQAVYNSTNGLLTGNIEFQVANVTNLDSKEKVKELGEVYINAFPNNESQKFIFDGSKSPSIFDLQKSSQHLKDLINYSNDNYKKLVVGFPMHLSTEPSMARMDRQPGSNILIVGKDPVGALDLLHNLNCQLLMASNVNKKVIVFDLVKKESRDLVSGTELSGRLSEIKKISNAETLEIYPNDTDLALILDSLTTDLEDRKENGKKGKPSVFVTIAMFENIKEIDYSMLDVFKKLLCEGPELGIHFIVYFADPDICQEILSTKKDLNQFETIIALKGEGASQFVGSYNTITETGYAMIKSPFAKNEMENIRLNSRIQEI